MYREALAQALDYAAIVSSLSANELRSSLVQLNDETASMVEELFAGEEGSPYFPKNDARGACLFDQITPSDQACF